LVQSPIHTIVGFERSGECNVLCKLLCGVGFGQTVVLKYLASDILKNLPSVLLLFIVVVLAALFSYGKRRFNIENGRKGG
jgi:hypothetical protein